jgi:hypothetical protein
VTRICTGCVQVHCVEILERGYFVAVNLGTMRAEQGRALANETRAYADVDQWFCWYRTAAA